MEVLALPKLILIKQYDSEARFYAYKDEANNVPHSIVVDSDKGAFSPYAKIEVEPANFKYKKYVHLRFCHNNRYIGVKQGDPPILVAESIARDEDESKPSCTMFNATVSSDDDYGIFNLQPVSNTYKTMNVSGVVNLALVEGPPTHKLRFVDCDTIVKLPDHVAFKAPNLKYLQKFYQGMLKFSCDDPNNITAGFRIKRRPDGYIRIMDYDGKYWRVDSDKSIHSDKADDDSLVNKDGAFWAVKIDDNTIALRSAAQNDFCKPLTIKNDEDFLSASTATITREARLEVKELVMQRKIHDVTFMLDDGRIIDEKPYLAGKTTVVNRGDKDDSIAVEIVYQEEMSSTFSSGMSLTAGLSTTFKAGVPFIADGGIQVSFERSASFQWDKTTSKTTSVKATDTVPVPANSMVVVHYVGTTGTCSVPFSYIQQDIGSTHGEPLAIKRGDGNFTGVSCYNFNFEVQKYKPLPEDKPVVKTAADNAAG